MPRSLSLFTLLFVLSTGTVTGQAQWWRWIRPRGPATSTATYYVDCASGSDANNGGSTATPWQHHPFMRGWTGTYTHKAGDAFIFKGGVTCPASYFTMTITAGGSSAKNDSYGVDPTWHVGTFWTRPIFDLQGQAPSGNKSVVLVNASYITFENLEIANLFIPAGSTFAASSISIVFQHDIRITKCLIRNWTTNSLVDDQMGGVTTVGSWNVTVDHSIIYGTLVNGNKTMGACTFNVDKVQYSTLSSCSNGVFAGVIVHDNTIHDIGQSNDLNYHENALLIGGGLTNLVYNNVVYNCNHGTCVYPNPGNGQNVGSTTYIYNNVVYGSVVPTVQVDMTGVTSATTSLFVYNNTLHCPGGNCVRIVPPGGGAIALTNLTVQNNHYMSDGAIVECWNNAGGSSSCGAVTNPVTVSNNVLMTTATATAQGYTAALRYAPTQVSNGTVQAGTNAPSALFTSDLLGIARPSDSWDVGAYQFVTSPSDMRPH